MKEPCYQGEAIFHAHLLECFSLEVGPG